MRRSEPRNKSDLSRRCGMANRLTRQRFCTSFFSWHDVLLKVLMRILRLGSLWFFFFLLLASVLPAFSQDSNSPPPPAAPDSATVSPAPNSNPPANPASFNDV